MSTGSDTLDSGGHGLFMSLGSQSWLNVQWHFTPQLSAAVLYRVSMVGRRACRRVQCWDGPIEEICPGDVIQFAPGEKHWHGAAPTTAMTHIVIHEYLDGNVVNWLEHVSDEQYQKGDK